MNNTQNPILIAEVPSTLIGPIWLAASEHGLLVVDFFEDQVSFAQSLEHRFPNRPIQPLTDLNPSKDRLLQEQILLKAVRQIDDYLAGKRKDFDLLIDWSAMAPFQQSALRATCAIPRGQVATYAEIASRIGRPRAARAVGRAEATNPMPLVIPCHRVVGSDGKLHGYGGRGGLQTKAWLLQMEGGKK